MKNILILLGLIPTILFGQSTTPTERAVLSAGTTITRLPATATTTVSATDTVLVFKGGQWYKTTTNSIIARDSFSVILDRGMGTGAHNINFSNLHGLYYYRSADLYSDILFRNAGPFTVLGLETVNNINGNSGTLGLNSNSATMAAIVTGTGGGTSSFGARGSYNIQQVSGTGGQTRYYVSDTTGVCLSSSSSTFATAMLDVRGSTYVHGDSVSLVSNDGINIYASDSLALQGNKISVDGVLNLSLSGSDSIHIASTVTRVRGGDFNIYDGGLNVPDTINTSAGNALTQNCIAGSFRKNNSGSTFTVTNTFAKSTSIILLTPQSALTATGYNVAVTTKNNGSFVVTFYTAGAAAAPASNFDIGYLIINKLN